MRQTGHFGRGWRFAQGLAVKSVSPMQATVFWFFFVPDFSIHSAWFWGYLGALVFKELGRGDRGWLTTELCLKKVITGDISMARGPEVQPAAYTYLLALTRDSKVLGVDKPSA